MSGNYINQFFQINEPFLALGREIIKLNESSSLVESRKKNLIYRFKDYLVNNSSVFIYVIISFFWVTQKILNLMLTKFF